MNSQTVHLKPVTVIHSGTFCVTNFLFLFRKIDHALLRFSLVAQKTTRVHPSPRVCFVMTAEADADEKGNVVKVTKVRVDRAVEDYGYCRYTI